MTKRAKEKETQNYIRVMGRAPTMEEYINSIKQGKGAPKFKGGAPAWLTLVSHNLENHNLWRLISTDAGLTTGRVKSSRNKYEAREYLFRDLASMYFYMGALPHSLWLLNKASKTAKINPKAALETQRHLIEKLGGSSIGVDDFGKALLDKTLRRGMDGINFENDVIKLSKLEGILDPATYKKALSMSQLQPKVAGESLLSSGQVKDVLSNNWLSEPKYLKRMTIAATDGLSAKRGKFVAKKEIEGIRQSADNFAQSLLDFARKKGVKEIDAKFVENFTRKNILTAAGFTVAGLGVACLGLAWIVPKLQQLLTYKTSGENAFPGTHNYKDAK